MENPLSRIFRRGRKSGRLTPDGLPITEFPPQITRLLRLYNAGGSSYVQIYASQPNVRAVVDDLAREAADLSLKMYLKDPRGALFPDARIEVDHPMMDLLAEPSPRMSPFRFWFQLFNDIGVYDIAHWLKVLNGGPKPVALLRIPPDNLTADREPVTGIVRGWRIPTGEIVPVSRVVTFWGHDPAVNHGSISPLETLRRILAEESAQGVDREHRWNNALRKDGVIEQPVDAPKMSDEARESFLTDLETALSGSANTATPALLEPGMSWKDIEWSPKDMEYINGRKLNRVEVAAAYHYPAAKVLAGAGGDPNSETLHYFYTSTLPPYLTRVEDEIEAQLLPDFEVTAKTRKTYYLAFNLDGKLRGSFEEQAAIMATTAGGPVVTVNEARARLNLPPIEDGDLIFIPLNSMRGGGPQGSPQAPLDTPAPGLNPAGTTPTPQVPTPLPAGNAPSLPAGTVSSNWPVATYKEAEALLRAEANSTTVEAILEKHDLKLERSKAREAHAQFLRETRARYEERYAKMLERHFARQRNAAKGGKASRSDRWDRELADDIFGILLQAVEHVGSFAAKLLKVPWSTERTHNYLRESAKANAEAINGGTAEQVRSGTDPFTAERALQLATGLTTFSIGWGTNEAVHQNEDALEEPHKTWIVTSDNPRPSHAKLNGTSVPHSKTFANGLNYPGDGSTGNADEVANCTCVMAVSA